MGKSFAEENPDINRIAIVAVMIAGAFVAILNQTLMNVALPVMMEDLNINANTAQWLTTVYMLVNGVLIPVTAFLMEKYTTRQLFITAMTLFAIGTLACGIAPGFDVLIIGRVIQAAGAGILMPLLTNVILTIFPVEERGKAMGFIGIAMIFAPAIGPTLSGWVVEHYSWRVLFFIVLPIAVIDIIVASLFLKNVMKRTFPKIDVLSIILSTFGFGGILYGCSTAGNPNLEGGWTNPEVLITLGVGVVSLVLFIWRQMKSKRPMLEFSIFKYPMFSLTTLINMIITMAMFAAMIIVPIYLQSIRGFSPIQSGLLLLPGAIIMGIMSPITGTIFDKIGARWLAVTGLVITVITTYEFTNLTDDMAYSTLIILYSARMFGMSMLMMPIMTAGLNALPQRLNPHGTAMSNTFRQVAGSIGTALLVTVMTNHATTHFKEMAVSSDIPPKVLGIMAKIKDSTDMKTALAQHGVDPAMIAKVLHVKGNAMIEGMNDAFMVATGLAVAALILAFFIKKVKPADEEDTKEEKQTSNVPVSEG